jgi:hypothetical protein
MSRRLGLWITVLALPLAALGLLLAEPDLDLRWEHHPSHFWLVLTVAGVNVALGLVASEVAARRDDDRTFLVSMALLASAGFLGLHALATPGILVDPTTAGFSVAARVGLLLAAGFAAISALGPDSRVVRVLARHHRRVRVGAVGGPGRLGAGVPGQSPTAGPAPATRCRAAAPRAPGAGRGRALWDRRPPVPRALPPATPAASAGRPGRVRPPGRGDDRGGVLADLARHVVGVACAHGRAFGAILVAARVEYRREGSLTAVFAGIYLDSTLRRSTRSWPASARRG